MKKLMARVVVLAGVALVPLVVGTAGPAGADLEDAIHVPDDPIGLLAPLIPDPDSIADPWPGVDRIIDRYLDPLLEAVPEDDEPCGLLDPECWTVCVKAGVETMVGGKSCIVIE